MKRDAYNAICRTVQHELRDMQDKWLNNKADEIQGYPDRHELNKFYDAL